MAPDEMVAASAKLAAAATTLASSDKNKAYVTFLAGTGDYVKGVVVGLAKGLRKVKSVYHLWWQSCQTYWRSTAVFWSLKVVWSGRLSPSTLRRTRPNSPCLLRLQLF